MNANNATILIAEGSPVQAELLRRVLAEAGYKVLLANDGAEAFAKAKASRPDAIATDINMPVMDGYALCRAIRQNEDLKFTPVILLTTLTEPLDVIRGLNAGADGYVTKANSAPTLLARIESLLAHPLDPAPDPERRKAEIWLAGERHMVDAHGPRLLNLLVSTYENAVLRNRELEATQAALEEFNRQLDQVVIAKTAQLQASERRFRALIENASDLVAVLDTKGAVSYVSPSIERLGGYKVDDVLGRSFLELMHEGDRPVATAGFAELLRNLDNLQWSTYRFQRKDGTYGVLEAAATNALADPAIGGIVINARDVSEREEARTALERSERFYRKLIEGGSEAFFVHDANATITYHSESATELLGYDQADVIGKSITNFVAPESVPLARRAIAEVIEHPDMPSQVELCVRRRDGSEIDIEAVGRNLLGDPNVAGIVVTVREITERKRAEATIRASREMLRSVVENAPIRVFWKDRDSRYLGCNSLFARDAGLSRPEDLVGKDDFQMGWRGQAELYREDDRRVMDSGQLKIGFEEPQTTPDGGTIWLRTSKVPLHDPDGNVFGILGIYEDITERKAAERTIQRINRALRVLSEGNMALVHATDEQSLLAEMCRVIVEVGGYLVAIAAYARDDSQKSVEPVASHGVDRSIMKDLRLSWGDDELGRGAVGRAIQSGAPQLVRHAEADPRQAPWREVLASLGVWSELALPLFFESPKPFGALFIASSEVEAFVEDEVKLLSELAKDLAFGVATLRTRVRARESGERLIESLQDTIQAIASTLEIRDPYTGGHQRRVAALAVAIACEMGLNQERIHGLHLAGAIHDLGKIGVPAEILAKPTRLNEIELSLMQQHAQAGYEILKDVKFPWPIARIVREHHERLDGSGYPQGLKGEATLLESRILAVADVVEAMSSHRPYRPGLGIDLALKEIERGRATVYDEAAADACVRLFREKRFAFAT